MPPCLQVFTHSLEVDVRDGPRGRPMSALRLSVETTPGDPTRAAAEFEVQPSLWLMAGQAAATRLQTAAQQAARAVSDPAMGLNRLMRTVTGTETVVQWVKMMPQKVGWGGGSGGRLMSGVSRTLVAGERRAETLLHCDLCNFFFINARNLY